MNYVYFASFSVRDWSKIKFETILMFAHLMFLFPPERHYIFISFIMTKLNQSIFGADPELNDDQKQTADVIKAVRTTPRDSRFPTQNQANHCWNRYNEWLLCLKNTGDEEGCKNMKQMAYSICPTIWTDKWEEEREESTFSGLKV